MMAKNLILTLKKVFLCRKRYNSIDNQTFIYVISDEKDIKKFVFLQEKIGWKREIKKGLKLSDKIIFEGVNKLKLN